MGKNREGKFNPAKGKPSAAGNKKGSNSIIDHQLVLENKYHLDPDNALTSLQSVRHPNRHTEIGVEKFKPRPE